MTVHGHPQRHLGLHLPSRHTTGTAPQATDTATATVTGAHVLAGLRLLTGFVFLWAFLDKTFGFGYATRSGKGWSSVCWASAWRWSRAPR